MSYVKLETFLAEFPWITCEDYFVEPASPIRLEIGDEKYWDLNHGFGVMKSTKKAIWEYVLSCTNDGWQHNFLIEFDYPYENQFSFMGIAIATEGKEVEKYLRLEGDPVSDL